MNYDHEAVNHGCPVTADYFSTLLDALGTAYKYSDHGSPLEAKVQAAIRLVSEDLVETLERRRRREEAKP